MRSQHIAASHCVYVHISIYWFCANCVLHFINHCVRCCLQRIQKEGEKTFDQDHQVPTSQAASGYCSRSRVNCEKEQDRSFFEGKGWCTRSQACQGQIICLNACVLLARLFFLVFCSFCQTARNACLAVLCACVVFNIKQGRVMMKTECFQCFRDKSRWKQTQGPSDAFSCFFHPLFCCCLCVHCVCVWCVGTQNKPKSHLQKSAEIRKRVCGCGEKPHSSQTTGFFVCLFVFGRWFVCCFVFGFVWLIFAACCLLCF